MRLLLEERDEREERAEATDADDGDVERGVDAVSEPPPLLLVVMLLLLFEGVLILLVVAQEAIGTTVAYRREADGRRGRAPAVEQ